MGDYSHSINVPLLIEQLSIFPWDISISQLSLYLPFDLFFETFRRRSTPVEDSSFSGVCVLTITLEKRTLSSTPVYLPTSATLEDVSNTLDWKITLHP